VKEVSRIRNAALVCGAGALLAVIPVAPAAAATRYNPLIVAGTVRCATGSADALRITGGGESHAATLRPGGRYSVTFRDPRLPGTATAVARCNYKGRKKVASTHFRIYRPSGGRHTLYVNLVVR
jgi:hypothetical protein